MTMASSSLLAKHLTTWLFAPYLHDAVPARRSSFPHPTQAQKAEAWCSWLQQIQAWLRGMH